MNTNEQLSRIIELLEDIKRQNAPPPDMLHQEYVSKMKQALASGDRAALKSINRQYHAHRGIKI